MKPEDWARLLLVYWSDPSSVPIGLARPTRRLAQMVTEAWPVEESAGQRPLLRIPEIEAWLRQTNQQPSSLPLAAAGDPSRDIKPAAAAGRTRLTGAPTISGSPTHPAVFGSGSQLGAAPAAALPRCRSGSFVARPDRSRITRDSAGPRGGAKPRASGAHG